MNTYKSGKEVKAFKIEVIEDHGDTFFLKGECDIVKVNKNYMYKRDPKVGGYYVEYVDGYESYSPAKAFEEGYTLIN